METMAPWQAYFDEIARQQAKAEAAGREVGALPERMTVIFAGEPLRVTESQLEALQRLGDPSGAFPTLPFQGDTNA